MTRPAEWNDVAALLAATASGDDSATPRLMSSVYEELRRLARAQMAREPSGSTLQPTALVHEAWLRVATPGTAFESRAHFFGAAARAMRRILVERARGRGRLKRGGDLSRESLVDLAAETAADALDLVALDAALDALEARDKRKAEVVHLRFFSGLTIEETAEMLRLSLATVKSEWSFARAFLLREMAGHGSNESA